ncbi:Tn3 family transposase [Streptomyces sp. OE57]|uniref:Tn3 family transposase n=1 Tax=Streptomyces lacaronensis TaxID=3379885 RepID=UPI0039B73A21
MSEVDVSAIPPRRLAELSRYGPDGKASLLRRHGDSRRLATLLATAVYLTSRAVDDALDLLEVLIATKLLSRAERETAKEKLKTLPRVERASAKLAAAFQIVFDSTSEQVDTATGEITPPEVETLEAMWERIEQVVPRHELAAAIAALFELTPPLDSDADEARRTQLVTRFAVVRLFLKLLVTVVDFDATPEGLPVLKALKSLPDLMGRKKVGPAEIDTGLLTGSWRRLMLSAPHLEPGTVDWKAYAFSVLEQVHRMLRRREVFAKNSSKWGDPRAKPLEGDAWEQAKPSVLASLGLPAGAASTWRHGPRCWTAPTARSPHGCRRTRRSCSTTTAALHFAALEPEPEPASLRQLREAVEAMLPRVDLPEALLEVFLWTGADQAFTSVTGGEARLKDLHMTIAALLVAHSCNVGYTPVIGAADALKYGRLSHVDQTYLRLATYRAANVTLIDCQASIPLAQAWGGGLVASMDGMRFVVPVTSVYARPNPKYFGRRGGATWLNMINDQAAGLGGKVVAGTLRDSPYVLDVLYDRDGGKRPEMIVTDTASYSDIVFGLLTLAGFAYAPQLADLPDQKMWRTDRTADYGAFQDAARGRVDLARIERHWEDILRIIGSIHTGAVRALGDAIAHSGRIAKTLHILRLADEPGYRRRIKSQANLQEGRHSLARKIFHGRSGQLYQRYQDGMEDLLTELLRSEPTRPRSSTHGDDSDPQPGQAAAEAAPHRRPDVLSSRVVETTVTHGGSGAGECRVTGRHGPCGAKGRPGRGDRQPTPSVPIARRGRGRGSGSQRVPARHARQRRQPDLSPLVRVRVARLVAIPVGCRCAVGTGRPGRGQALCPVAEEGQEAAATTSPGRSGARVGQPGDRQAVRGRELRSPHTAPREGGRPQLLRVPPRDARTPAAEPVPEDEACRGRASQRPPQPDARLQAPGPLPAQRAQANPARHP